MDGQTITLTTAQRMEGDLEILGVGFFFLIIALNKDLFSELRDRCA